MRGACDVSPTAAHLFPLYVHANPSVVQPAIDSRSREGAGQIDEAVLRSRLKAKLFGHIHDVRLGRFELLRLLGQGGEGTVYEARDPLDGSIVALKQLHPVKVASGASLKREFRAMADLVHPNLAVLHELFHVDAQWFYTMELTAGDDFITYVRAESHALFERLKSTLMQVLRGLAALHDGGYIHRDLKPSNVLVRPGGHVVILDYGLVVAMKDNGSIGCNAGTPAYAAPEQADGRAESASDLYALGAMLYQALTGAQLPTFAARSGAEGGRTAVLGRASEARVESQLYALCERLLEPDPRLRPTAREALALCERRVDRRTRDVPRMAARQSDYFVGRDDIFATLAELTDRYADMPRVALIHGESGIGKSAVLERFLASRRRAGALVLHGRCYERESLPFKALDAILEGVVQYLGEQPEKVPALTPAERGLLARLLPAFGRLGGEGAPIERPRIAEVELRARTFETVRALFDALCRRQEVVLAIDDLQWGDSDSVALLEYVLGAVGAPPILLLGVLRSEEASTSPVARAVARDALRGSHVTRRDLTLGPLAGNEARRLLKTIAPVAAGLSDRQLESCLTHARGLPFALLQLVEHLRDAPPSAHVDTRFEEVVRARAQRCSDGARALLEVLCVAGRPLETALALRSTGVHPLGWSAASELCGRKLARWRDLEHERGLEPYHDLVRRAITRDTPKARFRAIHLAIAASLGERAGGTLPRTEDYAARP